MAMKTSEGSEKFRIDKWLWAARFFRTRALATAAVECGKVLVNDTRAKPAKCVVPDDTLDIRTGQIQFVVEVLALSIRRGPASEAQKLYRETGDSRERRLAIAGLHKEQPPRFKGRPTKHERRAMEQLKKKCDY